jgi:hypothetical protein
LLTMAPAPPEPYFNKPFETSLDLPIKTHSAKISIPLGSWNWNAGSDNEWKPSRSHHA